MAVNMSYPKVRDVYSKFFALARTDSATEKAWLPKDAVVVGATIIQSTACDGTTGTISVGISGGGTEFVNVYNASTNDTGQREAGAYAGSYLIAGTKLTTDKKVVATFTAGDSSAGGAGFCQLDYVVLGAGEDLTD
jgi:hypothetical protein